MTLPVRTHTASVEGRTTITTIADVPNDFALVQNDVEIDSILDHIGFDREVERVGCLYSVGCLFVKTEQGEYTDVLASPSTVPHLTHPVRRLL